MQRLHTKTNLLLLLTALLTATACTDEEPGDAYDPARAIRLSANRLHVVTRAGDNVEYFADGSKYSLFMVQHAASNWSASEGNVKLYAGEGTENGTAHSISYDTKSYNSVDEAIDVYGLSYDNTTLPMVCTQSAAAPTITLTAAASEQLPDLLHSKNVQGHKANDGNIEMQFEHALSRLTFEVMKMDESTLDTKRLVNLKLKDITLVSRQTSATMDVTTGTWTPSATTADYTCFHSDAGEAVGEEPSALETALSNSAVRIFPVEATKAAPVQIRVTFSHFGTAGNEEVTSTYDITDVNFRRNTTYKLSILAMQDGTMRIITISPTVYDWSQEWVDPQYAVVGQPIVIGGVVWMDRNVGATSADCEHDYMHTLGAYFSYGRSIPYYLDLDMMMAPDNIDEFFPMQADGRRSFANTKIRTTSKATKIRTTNYPADENAYQTAYHAKWYKGCIYTWDNNGNKVTTTMRTTLQDLVALSRQEGNIFSGKKATQLVAISPGDEGDYSFIADYYSTTTDAEGKTTNSGGIWYAHNTATGGGSPQGFDDTTFGSSSFFGLQWKDYRTQPVPKGWRLPTFKEAYTLIPEESFSEGWAYRAGIYTTGLKNTSSTAKTYGGDYKYQYIHGYWRVKKDATADGDGLYPVEASTEMDTKVYVAYGIKHQGTSEAYRIKIEQRPSNIYNGKYVRFSIYPATKDDELRISGTATTEAAAAAVRWNLNDFDWEHPSAIIDFPLPGALGGSSGKCSLGSGAFGDDLKSILNNCGKGAYSSHLTLKLSKSDGIGVYGTYQTTSGPMRLVRDLTAE